MSLINCPACSASISSQASACPRCGHPVGSRGTGTPLSTIQFTSKRLKAQLVISRLLTIAAVIIFWIIIIGKNRNPQLLAAGLIAGGLGVPWYFLTKLRIWWHHK